MKIYIYNGIEYKDEQTLRNAIFKYERKVFGEVNTEAEWNGFGVVCKNVEVKMTEEQMARQARIKRDRLLSACDYYVMPDYPSSEQGLIDVKAYRQALRDITKQDGFPYQIDWPVKPSVLG